MLGRTNITKLEKGTIIDDVADYGWDNIYIDNISGIFIKILYAAGTLVGITADGTIAYTKDGENWETKKIELASGDSVVLTDAAYINGKYIVVGYHIDNENYMHGLMVATTTFIDYDIVTNWHSNPQYCYYEKIAAITEKNNQIIIFSFYADVSSPTDENGGTGETGQRIYITSTIADDAMGNSEQYKSIECCYIDCSDSSSLKPNPRNVQASECLTLMEDHYLVFGKRQNGTIVYNLCHTNEREFAGCVIRHRGAGKEYLLISKNGKAQETLMDMPQSETLSIFNCRNNIYIAEWISVNKYFSNLYKYTLNDESNLSSSAENTLVSSNMNYGFIAAAYFNKCEIFINNHEMLVIHPGEDITNKTLDDLIEITYDFSINSIIAAFGKLYVFGPGGRGLVSNNVAGNEETRAVATMSASRALYDAKVYTDKRIEELKILLAEM